MKLTSIGSRVINEAFSKEIFKLCFDKWKRQNESLTPEITKTILDKYETFRDRINDSRWQVNMFLAMFENSQGGITKEYNIERLKNPSLIDLNDILKLISLFYSDWEIPNFYTPNKKEEAVEDPKIKLRELFNAPGENNWKNDATPEKIEVSKKMWTGPENAVVNEDGFRVYKIDSQEQAVWMGYYYQEVYKQAYDELDGNNFLAPWCITQRVLRKVDERGLEDNTTFNFPTRNRGVATFSFGNSMYMSYRGNPRNSKFYFIIDDSKPVTNFYKMSALQVRTNSRGNLDYVITALNNAPNEKNTNWEELVSIYPKLKDHKDDIIWEPKGENESGTSELTRQIEYQDAPGRPEDIAIQPLNIKQQYIIDGKVIKSVRAWKTFPDDLQKMYINATQSSDVLRKFPTLELLSEIKRTKLGGTLDFRLQAIGVKLTTIELMKQFLRKDYHIIYLNKENEDVFIVRQKNGQKCGIYDLNTGFLKKDGVSYTCDFTQSDDPDDTLDIEENGEMYFGVKYTRSSDYFYVVFSLDNLDYGYFISKKNMQKYLNNKSEDKKLEPEKMSDIKEKMGV
jgi:hypothetical protein